LYPTKIRNLITMVTPVDFHTSKDLLSKWVKRIDVGALVSQGNVAGETLNHVFLALMPFRLMQQKYVDLVSGGAEPARIENFMRLESGSSTVRIRPPPRSENSCVGAIRKTASSRINSNSAAVTSTCARSPCRCSI
jgi:hypothetical protein